MLASTKNAVTISGRQLKYICPECQFLSRRRLAALSKRQLSYATLRASANISEKQRRRFRQRTYFSTLPRLRSLQDASQTPNIHDSPPLSSLPRPLGPGLGQKTSGQSVIRDHLRAWSIQNQKERAERAEAEFAGDGRLTTLPNSLFIEESMFDQETRDEDDELAEYEDANEGPNAANLYPGDLFYFRAKGIKGREQLAVYLGIVGTQHQVFLSNGRWLMEAMGPSESPILRDFAPAEEIESIQKHLPVKPLEAQDSTIGIPIMRSFAGDVPQADAAPLMRRLAAFSEEMLTFRRDNLRLLDALYERLADEEHYTCLSLEELVGSLLTLRYEDLSYAARMMIYLTLRRNTTVIQPVFYRRARSPSFLFTPRNLAKQFEQVCEWTREYQESAAQAARGKNVTAMLERNPLTAFVEKARRLILKSRALRSPTTTGSLGPSSVQSIVDGKIATRDTGETFSEEDQMILEFLWDCYIRTPVPSYRNRHHSIGSLILRAIGAYPKLRLERRIGSLLLQELGVLAPWADAVDQNTTHQIPRRKGAHEIDLLCTESDKVCETLGLNENPDHNQLEDTMASLRHDWGDLDCFCVDSATTRIKDDAYSLEPNPTIPGTYWIHVHVAHPSAFIHPDHIFSERARRMGSSLYNNTFTYPMMPWGFSSAMSIDAHSPAITVSTLLADNGEVKDIRIRPTRVRNVVVLEPDAVSSVLGRPTVEKAYLIVGKGADTHVPPVQDVPEEALKGARRHLLVLQKLDGLLKARIKARRREVPEFANWSMDMFNMNAWVSNVEDYNPNRLFQSYHYLGDPAIRCVTNRTPLSVPYSELENFESLTTMAMNLAAESAGKWFADRNIPACFNGSSTQPGFPLSKLNTMGARERKLLPITRVSSSPIPHVYMDVKTYLRFTSPIRRFDDLLAQWQADAYLRAEADGLLQPGEDANKITLPFSRAVVDEYVTNEVNRVRALTLIVSKLPTSNWTLRALFRAFHFKEAVLPEVWDFRVYNRAARTTDPDDTGIRGGLIPFHVGAKILKSAEAWETSATRGSYLPVKIELVDLDAMLVICRPIGPPSDTLHCTDPIGITPRQTAP